MCLKVVGWGVGDHMTGYPLPPVLQCSVRISQWANPTRRYEDQETNWQSPYRDTTEKTEVLSGKRQWFIIRLFFKFTYTELGNWWISLTLGYSVSPADYSCDKKDWNEDQLFWWQSSTCPPGASSCVSGIYKYVMHSVPIDVWRALSPSLLIFIFLRKKGENLAFTN